MKNDHLFFQFDHFLIGSWGDLGRKLSGIHVSRQQLLYVAAAVDVVSKVTIVVRKLQTKIIIFKQLLLFIGNIKILRKYNGLNKKKNKQTFRYL